MTETPDLNLREESVLNQIGITWTVKRKPSANWRRSVDQLVLAGFEVTEPLETSFGFGDCRRQVGADEGVVANGRPVEDDAALGALAVRELGRGPRHVGAQHGGRC